MIEDEVQLQLTDDLGLTSTELRSQERSDTKGFEPHLVTVDSCKSTL